MFRTITFLSIALFSILATLIFIQFAKTHTEDREAYTTLVTSRVGRRPKKAAEGPPIQQMRTGVQKDFWTQKHNAENHVRLTSDRSVLWVKQRKKKFEITEHLESLNCCMQEGATNELKWLTAEEGSFAYPANHFTARHATLSLFSLQEPSFPTTFPAPSPHSSIAADVADWDWPNALHLSGQVRLFSTRTEDKQTFALADELFYHPSTGAITLHAEAPKKVLLWQDDRRLSSPAIEIVRDPKKKTEEIKGIGDVRLSFNAEEEALFRKVFNR